MRSRECVTTLPEPIKNQYRVNYLQHRLQTIRNKANEKTGFRETIKTFVEYRKDLNGEMPRSPTEEDNHRLPFSPITLEFQCKAT